jgi:hypothetical protein
VSLPLSWSIGLAIAIVVVFSVAAPLEQHLRVMDRPLARIKAGTKSRWLPVMYGASRLCWTYLFVVYLFALTGGSLAQATVGPSTDPKAMLVAMVVGVLVAALARVLAITSTVRLVPYVLLVGAIGAGLLAAQVLVDPRILTTYSDALKATLPDMPFYGLLMSIMACTITEGLVLGVGRRRARTSHVPYSLVRARAEGYEQAEQTFWGHHVRDATTTVIKETIQAEGLKDMCWLTRVAPDDHVEALTTATKEWIRQRWPHATPEEVERRAYRLIAERVRIITHQDRAYELRHPRDLSRCAPLTRIHTFSGCVRTRVLTVNHRIGVVHLPIPFTGEDDEESNCAHVTRVCERVHDLTNQFEAFWRGRAADSYLSQLDDIARTRDVLRLSILCCAASTRQAMTDHEMCEESSVLLLARPEPERFRDALQSLIDSGLVRRSDGMLRRNSAFCHECEDLLASLRRDLLDA